MDPMIESVLDVLEDLHSDVKKQISGLTQDELDWSPGDDMNSLAVLTAHVAGSERYWISDVIMQEVSGRVREEEFATLGTTEDALSKQLDSVLEYIREAFDRFAPDQLSQVRTSSQGDREYTVAWAIAHVLRHTSLHVGHMQITRQRLNSR